MRRFWVSTKYGPQRGQSPAGIWGKAPKALCRSIFKRETRQPIWAGAAAFCAAIRSFEMPAAQGQKSYKKSAFKRRLKADFATLRTRIQNRLGDKPFYSFFAASVSGLRFQARSTPLFSPVRCQSRCSNSLSLSSSDSFFLFNGASMLSSLTSPDKAFMMAG